MINGMHALIYSTDPEADRAFLRDVLGWSFVEDHPGWLIFRLPPGEVGVHPLDPGEPAVARALPHVRRRARDGAGAVGEGRDASRARSRTPGSAC